MSSIKLYVVQTSVVSIGHHIQDYKEYQTIFYNNYEKALKYAHQEAQKYVKEYEDCYNESINLEYNDTGYYNLDFDTDRPNKYTINFIKLNTLEIEENNDFSEKYKLGRYFSL
jgi:hypothetical protein